MGRGRTGACWVIGCVFGIAPRHMPCISRTIATGRQLRRQIAFWQSVPPQPRGGHKAQKLGPDGIVLTERGTGTNTRYINNIAMEDRDTCDSLIVTEVFTPSGNWSSFPSHRHDEDDFPRITYLEETYYHRIAPDDGFGIQRVYTEDGSLDETMAVRDGDVVLVPKGHHPCAAVYGYDMYYLNVMAGPLRKWRFQFDPAVTWIAERDQK